MITRKQLTQVIAQRDAIANEIQSMAAHLPFDKCLQLCGTKLVEHYHTANRLACLLEQQVIDQGRAYRLQEGTVIWRPRSREVHSS